MQGNPIKKRRKIKEERGMQKGKEARKLDDSLACFDRGGLQALRDHSMQGKNDRTQSKIAYDR